MQLMLQIVLEQKSHMSSLTAAIILAQNDIEPILQLTVRDRNRLALARRFNWSIRSRCSQYSVFIRR